MDSDYRKAVTSAGTGSQVALDAKTGLEEQTLSNVHARPVAEIEADD